MISRIVPHVRQCNIHFSVMMFHKNVAKKIDASLRNIEVDLD